MGNFTQIIIKCNLRRFAAAELAKAVAGRLSAHLQQITGFHLSIFQTNQTTSVHGIREVLVARAAEGRLSAHLQCLTRSSCLF